MIPILFFISLGVFVFSIIFCFLNMAIGFNNISKNMDFSKTSNIFTGHIVCMIMSFLGGVSSVVFGIWWIVLAVMPLIRG